MTQFPPGQVAYEIAHYKIPPLSGYAYGHSPEAEYIMGLVTQQLNPHYDATLYDAKKSQRVKMADYMTSGAGGSAINAFNTALQHIESEFKPAVAALNNGKTLLWNRLANEISRQAGYTPTTNFSIINEIVGDEIAKAIMQGSGGRVTEGDRKRIHEMFSVNNSPQQLLQSINIAEAMMGQRLNSLREQWTSVYGADSGKEFDDRFLLPYSRQMAERYANHAAGGGKYHIGQILTVKGKQYRVTGGDMNTDPDVEPVQ